MEWILESSLLVLMILGIRKVFSGRIRYAVIYALWIVVLLRFMIPVNFISTPFSAGNILAKTVSSWTPAETSRQNSEVSGSTEEKLQQKEETSDLLAFDSVGEISAKHQQTKWKENKTNQEPKKAFRGLLKLSSVNWRFLLGGGWLTISGILFLWIIVSNVSLFRKIKQNRILYGEKNTVKVYAASYIKTPCLYGFFRPAIYIPKAFVSSDSEVRDNQEELEQIITHEYVHYRHGDHIWAMLRTLLVSVYWFDPFLWLAVSCSRKDAELFCDETVIRLLGEENRFRYGKMLVRLAGDASWGDFRYSMMAMSRRGKEMEKRIRAISNKKQYSKWILIPLVVIVSVAVSITCSAGIAPLPQQKKAAEHVAERSTVTGAALSSTGQEEEKNVQASEGEIKKQLSLYSDYLNTHAEDEKYQYYSLVWLGEDHIVLLVSSKVNEINREKWGSDSCQIYNIINEKVVFCGNIACSSGAWIRFSQGKIWTNTQSSITKAWVTPESDGVLMETAEKNGQAQNDGSQDYTKWLSEFAQSPGILFYTNPYIVEKTDEGEPEALALQNNGTDYLIAGYTEEEDTSAVYASAVQDAFQDYIEIFTDAVNSGNVDKMDQVLAAGSDVYEQQCALAKNYHKRGIREKIKSCSISSAALIGADQVAVDSRETIKVFYADATVKIIKQKYRYTCEYINQKWIITKMEEIS